MKQWNDVKDDLQPDGTLRDIYVTGIAEPDWDDLINEVAGAGFSIEFTHGGNVTALPKSFRSIRELQNTDPTTLKVMLQHGIQVNCHFFVDSEIEMDISPGEVAGPVEFDVLISFLRWIAETLNRPVVLTYENSPDQEILRVDRETI